MEVRDRMNTGELEPVGELAEQGSGRRTELLGALTVTFRALMWQGNKQGAVIMERIGLTLPQAAVMWALRAIGGRATMSEIARLTFQSAATVTGIVDRLADAGLVERERDRDDRRVIYVRTTQAGVVKLEEIDVERRRQMAQMTMTLTDEELDQLNGIMSKLITDSE
jgi:DNA-binding MarR family transcriptional regulator